MQNSNSAVSPNVWSDYGTSKGALDSHVVKENACGALDFSEGLTGSSGIRDNIGSIGSNGAFLPIDGRSLVARKPVSYAKQSDKLLVLQKWEGTVLEVNVDEEIFNAYLIDKTNPENPEEEVTLSFDELSLGDLMLLREGAIFYWSIGYSYRGATKSKVSTLHFSRLKRFSSASISEAQEYGALLEDLFSDNN